MPDQRDLNDPIEHTYVFDVEMSQKGYLLNQLAESLTSAENRAVFKADLESYMDRFGLTDGQKVLIRNQDWLNVVRAGCNIYHVIRLAAQFGTGLYPLGAQQLGITYKEFLESRNVKGAT